MAVMVTGGAGFIGSNAVARLIASGERVVVLDNLSTGHRGALHPEAIFVEGHIDDSDKVHALLVEHEVDTVMHFAAFIVVPESCSDPAKYFHNNIVGSHALLNAMKAAGVTQFIFSSTAAVYGYPDKVPIREDAKIQPLNPYGLSKRVIEQMAEWYDSAYGFRYAILRYFNAAGASEQFGEDHHPETHLIPNILMAAEGRRSYVDVFGSDYATPDGTCVRDYIHVEDLVDAHLLAVQYLRDGGSSQIMNLGNSVGASVLEVIDAVRKVTGSDFEVRFSPRRAGDSDKLVASSDHARSVLGWCPQKSEIEMIVRDAWTWRQAHPDGYRDQG